jgi:2-methylcitrate dehydratase PrpD
MSATAELAALAVGLSWENVPEAIRARAKLALLDSVGCAVAGSATEPAVLSREALGLPRSNDAVVLGIGRRTTALTASFHNALAINALDFDDQAPTGGHPGAGVVAASLAAAEKLGCSGPQLLTALVAGYEVAMRVQAAIRPSPAQYERAHGNGTPLAFGAAAAVGRLLELDEQGMRRAFGIAGPFSPVPHAGKFGWDEESLSWVKDNVAWPAEAGMRAALLAGTGFVASESILDGDTGFWRMAASDRWDEGVLLGDGFLLAQLSFKPYPCCRWLHPMLDAVDELVRTVELAASDIDEVTVESTAVVARRFGNQRPRSLVDAQFSAPHAVAMRLLGVPEALWWRPENREDPRVKALMERVVVREDPLLTRQHRDGGWSANRVPARVTVHLRQGRESAAFCDHASGSPDHPRSQHQHVHDKAVSLLTAAYAPAYA